MVSKLKFKISQITKRPFIRDAGIIISGTIASQAITIAFSPIITRFYGPETFGLLGTFVALAGIVTPIAGLTYPVAIVLPRKDRDAKGIAKISIYISFIIATLITITILTGGNSILSLLKATAIANFIWIIPIYILFSNWLQVEKQWLIRKKQFKITAKITVFKTLLINSAKAIIGWFYPLATVLITLTTIDSAIYALMLKLGLRRKNKSNVSVQDSNNMKSLYKLAKTYNDFPRYRAPQEFINAISQSMPVLLLSALFSPAAAGFFVLGKRMLTMPSQLIGKSIGDVFYPKITEASHQGKDITQLILKTTLVLVGIGFFPFACVIIFGPTLFSFVFGSEWFVAGQYARWMAFMLFFMFANRPAVVAIPVLGLQKGLMIYELFSTSIKLIALYLGFAVFNTDIAAVALFSISGSISYIFLILWVLVSSKAHTNKVIE